MSDLRVRAVCARCALRTDYCDATFDRSEYPASWPFAFVEGRLPYLESLPATTVIVSSCLAGRDVYDLSTEGPCAKFVDLHGDPKTAKWSAHMTRSLADHAQ
jgi:hypothetical protein